MAKTKKKNISDVKLSKAFQSKKQNPFEVHINREKFKVLGQKSKVDKGLPGVARARAIKKRKETLLLEYKVQDKSNKFIDRRIGERNKGMTNEDKIVARFTAERMKAHKRKAMFNLAEEEVLTHKGRSITEVEKYDDPRSDDDDENEAKSGALDANFVEEAHFGGGIFSKSKNNGESVIDQLIADSKKRKLQRQQTREKTLQLTQKLDTEWKHLIPIVTSGHRKTEEDEVPNKGRGDPFDIAMRELKFEARGKPSDKLKSEEEIAEQEAKKLRDLEEERIKRMRGEDTQITVTRKQHRSADDLDDNFHLDGNEEFSLAYDKHGNLIPSQRSRDNNDGDSEEPVITKSYLGGAYSSEDEDDDDEDRDEEEDDDINYLKTEIDALNEEGDSNDEPEETTPEKIYESERKSNIKLKDNENVSKNKEMNEITMEKKKRSEIKSSMKSVVEVNTTESSDESMKKEIRKSSESSLNEYTEDSSKKTINSDKQKNGNKSLSDKEAKRTNNKGKVCFDEEVEEVKFGENASLNAQTKTTEEIRQDLMKRKELMDKARKELPFTYEAPKSYEDLQELFKGHNQNEVIVIIERIIKCNHPKLREENKQKMITLFAFLMQYLNDLEHENCWSMFDRLVPFLYDLMMFSPSSIAECLIEILKEKQSDYSERKHKYPSSATFVFLKLVPLLYPASDKRHPVTSPSLVFITQMLQNCKVTTRRSISAGLFLVTLIYEYTYLSKRICPQVLNFLGGLLHLASPANIKSSVVPPFKSQHRFLYLQSPSSNEITDYKMTADELSTKSSKIDDDFRIKSIYAGLNLLNLFVDLYESHHASGLLFLQFKNYLNSLEVSKYPSVFTDIVNKIKSKLTVISAKELEKLSVAVKKPKVLRLYEPSVEPVYDTKKKKGVSEEKAERDKLLHKIKREKKGALREIRRDRAFIAKIKFKQQQKSDNERIRKVKEIFSWGAQQQGEINAIQRLKNKKH